MKSQVAENIIPLSQEDIILNRFATKVDQLAVGQDALANLYLCYLKDEIIRYPFSLIEALNNDKQNQSFYDKSIWKYKIYVEEDIYQSANIFKYSDEQQCSQIKISSDGKYAIMTYKDTNQEVDEHLNPERYVIAYLQENNVAFNTISEDRKNVKALGKDLVTYTKRCRGVCLNLPKPYQKILQLEWCPYSEQHVGILTSGGYFYIYNLSHPYQFEQSYRLPLKKRSKGLTSVVRQLFTSFVWGYEGENIGQNMETIASSNSWSKYSVLFLQANGAIYTLCPVAVVGTIIQQKEYLDLIIEDQTKDQNSTKLEWINECIHSVSDPTLPTSHQKIPKKFSASKSSQNYSNIKEEDYTTPNKSSSKQDIKFFSNPTYVDGTVLKDSTHQNSNKIKIQSAQKSAQRGPKMTYKVVKAQNANLKPQLYGLINLVEDNEYEQQEYANTFAQQCLTKIVNLDQQSDSQNNNSMSADTLTNNFVKLDQKTICQSTNLGNIRLYLQCYQTKPFFSSVSTHDFQTPYLSDDTYLFDESVNQLLSPVDSFSETQIDLGWPISYQEFQESLLSYNQQGGGESGLILIDQFRLQEGGVQQANDPDDDMNIDILNDEDRLTVQLQADRLDPNVFILRNDDQVYSIQIPWLNQIINIRLQELQTTGNLNLNDFNIDELESSIFEQISSFSDRVILDVLVLSRLKAESKLLLMVLQNQDGFFEIAVQGLDENTEEIDITTKKLQLHNHIESLKHTLSEENYSKYLKVPNFQIPEFWHNEVINVKEIQDYLFENLDAFKQYTDQMQESASYIERKIQSLGQGSDYYDDNVTIKSLNEKLDNFQKYFGSQSLRVNKAVETQKVFQQRFEAIKQIYTKLQQYRNTSIKGVQLDKNFNDIQYQRDKINKQKAYLIQLEQQIKETGIPIEADQKIQLTDQEIEQTARQVVDKIRTLKTQLKSMESKVNFIGAVS